MALKLSVEVQAVTKDAIARLEALRQKLRDTGTAGTTTSGDFNALSQRLQELAVRSKSATDQIASGGKSAGAALSPVATQIGAIRGQLLGLVSGVAVLQGFRQFVTVTDQVSNLNAQLKLATNTSEDFAKAQTIVTDIANNFGVRVGDAATSFSRLSQALRSIGGGLKEATVLTEALSAAVKISGGSAQEAQSSMIQFAQALGSGVLQGDELRSILENNRRLAKALADGLKVTVGELKKLGEDGKLTAEVVAKAIISQLGVLKAEADSVPDTVERAGNRLANAFTTWVTASDQAKNAQANIISILDAVAANIDRVVKGLQIGATVIVGLLAGRAITALIGFATALRTVAAAAAAGGLALTGLAGPIGLVLGLLTAITAAAVTFGAGTAKAFEDPQNKVDAYVQGLDKALEKQRALNDEGVKSGPSLSVSSQALSQAKEKVDALQVALKAAARDLREAQSSTDVGAATFARKSVESLTQELASAQTILDKIVEIRSVTNSTFDSQEAKDARIRKSRKDFLELAKQFQTEAEKNAETVKQLRKAGAEGVINPKLIDSTVARVGQKKPEDPKTIRAANLAQTKQEIDSELRLQVDGFQREERALKESFDRRQISAQEFFTQTAVKQTLANDAQIKSLQELRALEATAATDPKAVESERIRAKTEVLRLEREIEIATRKQEDIETSAARSIVEANKAIASSLEDVRFKIKDLTGTATLDDLRKNIQKSRKDLFDALNGDEGAQLDVIKLTNIEAVQEQLQRFQKQADTVLNELSIKQEEVQIKANLGLLTEDEAQQKLNTERLKVAPILDEIIRKMDALKEGNVSAFGPEQEQAIARYKNRLLELGQVADAEAKKIRGAFEGNLANLFTDLVTGAKSAGDAFKDFANAVVQSLVRIAAEKAAKGILDSIFNAGSTSGGSTGGKGGDSTGAIAGLAKIFLAEGGMVRGPGTTTSDSVPAMLSRDEFVVKAATVKKVGPQAMYALNSGNPRLIQALQDATVRLSTGGMAQSSNVSEIERAEKVSASDSRESSATFGSVIKNTLARLIGRPVARSAGADVVVMIPTTETRTDASERESARVTKDSKTVASVVRAIREGLTDRVTSSTAFVSEVVDRYMSNISGKNSTRDKSASVQTYSDRSIDKAVDKSADHSTHAEIDRASEVSRSDIRSDVRESARSDVRSDTRSDAKLSDVQKSNIRQDRSEALISLREKIERIDTVDRARTDTFDRERIVTDRDVYIERLQHAEQATSSAYRFFSELSRFVSEKVFNAPRLALERAFERSSIQAFSTGGVVHGGGTTTSDSIPARLSRDEFVVKASTVQKVGAQAMYALNAGHPRVVEALQRAASGVRDFAVSLSAPPAMPQVAFADGGLVTATATTNNVTNNGRPINFVVQTSDVGGFQRNSVQIMQDLSRTLRAAERKA